MTTHVRKPRLLRLEDRLAPAIATWDGGGADNKWTTAANWAGDVTPQPGDDLMFPAVAARFANVNDFAANTAFKSITFTGYGYQITGNAIQLAAGVSSNMPAADLTPPAPDLGLDLTLTATAGPPVFSALNGGGFLVAGTVDLTAHTLTVNTGAGMGIRLAAGVVSGAITKTGGGSLTLDGPGYPAGGVEVTQGTAYVNTTNSPAAGQAWARGGVIGGTGVVGTAIASFGGTFDPGIGPAPATLTTGDLNVSVVGPSDPLGGRLKIDLGAPGGALAGDKLAVRGSVFLGGVLILGAGVTPVGRVTVIDNDGTDAVTGTFAGLPEGAVVQTLGGVALRITYKGGDGNDVELFADKERPALAVGVGEGGLPFVNVYGGGGGRVAQLQPYDIRFRGGVRVATADVTGDGVPDIVTAAGPGGGPHVRVFDGATFNLAREFFAYDAAFTGGVWVAAGDVNLDGKADIVTGAGAGGGPHVKVFSGADGSVLQSFLAYESTFFGGVTVAVFNGFVATGPGAGGGPVVRIFSGGTLANEFLAFDAAFRGGIFLTGVRAFGLPGDTLAVAPGLGGGPTVIEYMNVASRGVTMTQRTNFQAFDPAFAGGVRLAAADLDGDGVDEIVAAPGPGGGALFAKFKRQDPTGVYPHFAPAGGTLAFDPAFLGGIYVG